MISLTHAICNLIRLSGVGYDPKIFQWSSRNNTLTISFIAKKTNDPIKNLIPSSNHDHIFTGTLELTENIQIFRGHIIIIIQLLFQYMLSL